ncbi:MAG: alanine dehydrogenase [Bacteroidetes bacterium]|nr:alanine dehydrogenase [Bacteroidota bacterium]
MKIGLLREGKQPADQRVVLTPDQVRIALKQYDDLDIVVQPSANRCFADSEYAEAGVILQKDLSDCDVLIGVKEVPLTDLLEGKTYFMFSHTIKKQPYNRKLLRKIISENIRLIDYECLTNEGGMRVIAFGRWAGIVGAHNGLYTYGERTKAFELKRASACHDYADLAQQYKDIQFPPIRIATTGNGRVAQGAWEVLEKMGIRRVSPDAFLNSTFDEAVYTPLLCEHLYARNSDNGFKLREFFKSPELYHSIFKPYSKRTDLFINSIYWDPKAPAYFTLTEMTDPAFSIRAIADITCDIAPEASVPSTIRPSTIADPVYGFDPTTGQEIQPFSGHIDIMAVDNLPNELPRDASASFGEQFMQNVLSELLKEQSNFIDKATIARNGDLTCQFEYLRDYVSD